MINLFKNLKKECSVLSPVKGRCIPIEEVPDNMFANKLLGDGVAFVFEENEVYIPCDGEVVMIAHTKHAFGLKSKNGMEILIHIGLDTVTLNGEGFDVLIKQGQQVKAGDKAVIINQKLMREKGINLITPMVITNSNEYELFNIINGSVKTGENILVSIKK